MVSVYKSTPSLFILGIISFALHDTDILGNCAFMKGLLMIIICWVWFCGCLRNKKFLLKKRYLKEDFIFCWLWQTFALTQMKDTKYPVQESEILLTPRLAQEASAAVMLSRFHSCCIRTWELLSGFVCSICCSEAASLDACCGANDYHYLLGWR